MRVLLISEDFIKTNTHLNDNIWGQYLTPAIREAQEMGLQTIIGECLYNSILDKVDDGTIAESGNTAYKTLLDDFIQPYLMYKTIVDLVPIIGVKEANIGIVISNDEHIANITEPERNRIKTYYEYRSDFYCRKLQNFLLNNRTLFEELADCDCERMRANLKSAASIGLWVGGLRGRIIR